MAIDSTRHINRREAGQHLARHFANQFTALTDSDHPRLISELGHLGGFELTVTVHRALGKAEAVITFDGAPGIDMRLTPDEVSGADPGKLPMRLEDRLASLESQQVKHSAEIKSLNEEIGHARADLGRPFPQALQLAQARERLDDIEKQLQEAARPMREPTPDGDASGTVSPHEPAMRTSPTADSPVVAGQLARRSFPAANPVVGKPPSRTEPEYRRSARPLTSAAPSVHPKGEL